MAENRIEIVYKLIPKIELELLLFDFYGYKNSPYYPVHILSDWSLQKSADPNYAVVHRQRIRIGLAQDEQPSKTLANISISEYPEKTVMIINGSEPQEWAMVEKLVNDILTKSSDLGFKLIRTYPETMAPQKIPLGMSEIRKLRANIFRAIKDKNPELSYQGTANRANEIEFDKFSREISEKNPDIKQSSLYIMAENGFRKKWKREQFTSDDVRNDYRDMGWEWQRANKIR